MASCREAKPAGEASAKPAGRHNIYPPSLSHAAITRDSFACLQPNFIDPRSIIAPLRSASLSASPREIRTTASCRILAHHAFTPKQAWRGESGSSEMHRSTAQTVNNQQAILRRTRAFYRISNEIVLY